MVNDLWIRPLMIMAILMVRPVKLMRLWLPYRPLVEEMKGGWIGLPRESPRPK